MGFLAPALPWLVKGLQIAGPVLGGLLGGKKAQSSAQQRSPEEQAALAGAQGAGGALMNQGRRLTDMGLPALQSGMSYYQTLLSGNRSAMAGATAAPRGGITDAYRGATRNLDQSGIQGAARDVATADLNRDRTARIAGLTSGVQPAAADALMGGGASLVGEGNQSFGNAGSIWSGLLGQGQQNRVYARQEGEKAGKGIGGFLFDILSMIPGGKKSGLPTGNTPYPNSNGGIWG